MTGREYYSFKFYASYTEFLVHPLNIIGNTSSYQLYYQLRDPHGVSVISSL
jgi:hypothetical protein